MFFCNFNLLQSEMSKKDEPFYLQGLFKKLSLYHTYELEVLVLLFLYWYFTNSVFFFLYRVVHQCVAKYTKLHIFFFLE